MTWRWERGDLDRLVALWHAGWSLGDDLETFIRQKTRWSHEEYERWVVTGRPEGV